VSSTEDGSSCHGAAGAQGVWKMPTGLVNTGEDVVEAAAREVLEVTASPRRAVRGRLHNESKRVCAWQRKRPSCLWRCACPWRPATREAATRPALGQLSAPRRGRRRA